MSYWGVLAVCINVHSHAYWFSWCGVRCACIYVNANMRKGMWWILKFSDNLHNFHVHYCKWAIQFHVLGVEHSATISICVCFMLQIFVFISGFKPKVGCVWTKLERYFSFLLCRYHFCLYLPLVCIKGKTSRSCEFLIASCRIPLHMPCEHFWQAFSTNKWKKKLVWFLLRSGFVFQTHCLFTLNKVFMCCYNLCTHIHKYSHKP